MQQKMAVAKSQRKERCFLLWFLATGTVWQSNAYGIISVLVQMSSRANLAQLIYICLALWHYQT